MVFLLRVKRKIERKVNADFMMKEISPGVWKSDDGKLYTRNLTPGKKTYGEMLHKLEGVEYRAWNPHRSKLAAALMNRIGKLPISSGNVVLYLGAAEGTTASHVSDIVGEKGFVFGVDVSAKVMNKLTWLCEQRENMIPVLADASNPESYESDLQGFPVEVIFQDISQKEQAEIFMKNAGRFLGRGKHGLISIKARSISATGNAKEIIEKEVKKLKGKFRVLRKVSLAPFEKEHTMVLCKRK